MLPIEWWIPVGLLVFGCSALSFCLGYSIAWFGTLDHPVYDPSQKQSPEHRRRRPDKLLEGGE